MATLDWGGQRWPELAQPRRQNGNKGGISSHVCSLFSSQHFFSLSSNGETATMGTRWPEDRCAGSMFIERGWISEARAPGPILQASEPGLIPGSDTTGFSLGLFLSSNCKSATRSSNQQLSFTRSISDWSLYCHRNFTIICFFFDLQLYLFCTCIKIQIR